MGRVVLIVFISLAALALGVVYLYMSPADIPAAAMSYTNATTNDITVYAPQPRAELTRSFTITGNARGPWYFEASFPVSILGADGSPILQTHATAQSEWMTTEFVPFSVDITVPTSYTGPATIVLSKDNPSGLPEHDASVSFSVVIK
jgi:hypothetical protein